MGVVIKKGRIVPWPPKEAEAKPKRKLRKKQKLT